MPRFKHVVWFESFDDDDGQLVENIVDAMGFNWSNHETKPAAEHTTPPGICELIVPDDLQVIIRRKP
jgi:hypothetical protein